MKKVFAALLLAGSFGSVYAGQGVVLTLASEHIGAKAKYNQTNPGVGYSWSTSVRYLGDVDAQVGVYRNSESRTSVYVSATKYLWSSSGNGVRAGYAVGLATGYNGLAMPIAAGVASIDVGYFDVNVIVSGYRDSGDGDKLKPLIGLQIAFPF